MRQLLIGLACLIAAPLAAEPVAPTRPASVEVMALGLYHMANPGQDLHNVHVSDVTTPEKQRQVAAAVSALARFRPTAIAIESTDAGPDLLDRGYAKFTPADLRRDRNEVTQIGYRLAAAAGIRRVYAVDVQPKPGEPDDFPFDAVQAWASAHGRGDELAALGAQVQAFVDRFSAEQETRSVAALLAEINAPQSVAGEGQQTAFYQPLLRFGSGDDQPGATLAGRWYMRNAKIVAKLVQSAHPGDRIVIMFGSGHLYWLRHLIAGMPGYRLVDPLPYLSNPDTKAASAP